MAMGRRRAHSAVLALCLACLLHLGAALPAHLGMIKGKRLRKKKQGEQRLLSEQDYVAASLQRYLSNQELEEWLQGYEKRCKSIARLTSIGTSGGGSSIWALEISDRPGQVESEPAVKYVGNVHGDEPTGRVLTLALAEWLCANHKTDPRAKRIVQTMHLWLVPTMNPDGFTAKTRGNGAGQDLNRDFPDRFSAAGMQPSGKEQPETAAVMAWSQRVGFVASASMHEGALVANYPWDGTKDQSTRYDACPDDATFKYLATLYATTHRKMAGADNPEFPGSGITNGGAWYPIYGSMQDWNYLAAGCLELTLELSQNKWPAEAGLADLWLDNRDALLAFPLAAAYGGVWGTVREEGKLRGAKGQELPPLAGANITVLGMEGGQQVLSREGLGDYYRPLAPGRYTVVVSKPGYTPVTANLTVPADGSGAQRHFVLAPEASGREGGVIYSLKAALPAGAAADPALPWQKGSRKAQLGELGLDGLDATRGRDRLYLLGAGAACAYGLWVTHARLKRRAHSRRS